MSILSKVLGFITNPLADLVGGWDARKTIAAETAAAEARAKSELKVTKFQAKAERLKRESEMDFDYDLQVLKNRDSSLADELIILVWFSVFLMHFIPATQLYMAKGWDAMGYTSEPPWWFEFGMIGILVSTLGLMRILKLFVGKVGKPSLQKSRVLSETSG